MDVNEPADLGQAETPEFPWLLPSCRGAAIAAGELTPLRMTLVGAMLIAVGPISMTLYTPALTLLAHVFATTEDAVRTTITVYLFGFALAQLLCGPLSDRFGRRPVVLVCLALYVVGAAVCAGAGSVTMLCLGRVVQGVGACGGMALSRVMVVDRFSGPPAARIISLMSSSSASPRPPRRCSAAR